MKARPDTAGPLLHVLWHMRVGGAERAVFQLVREQRRQGKEADVLVGSVGDYYGRETRTAGAHVHEAGLRNAVDLRALRRATKIFRQYRAAHFHGPEPVLMAAAAMHSDLRLYYTHRAGIKSYSAKKRLRHAVTAAYLRRRFNGVCANSIQSAHAAKRIFRLSGAIPVIHNGLDFELLEPARTREVVRAELGVGVPTVVVGTAAKLQAWKRVHLLLLALAQMPENGVDVHVVVVGDGPARQELQQMAATLGVDARVTFTGQTQQIADYLHAFDIFVLPSGPEEAFGNAVVEAMGVGLPSVIFSDGGGLAEHVTDRDTGFVVDDVDGLAAVLTELASDPPLRELVGGRARRSVRGRYTLEAMIRAYDAFYRSGDV